MQLRKLSFLPTLFLKNEVRISRSSCAMMLFMSGRVDLPNLGLILQEMKIGPKSDICLFAQNPSIILMAAQNVVNDGY